jgi:hypothetical protein
VTAPIKLAQPIIQKLTTASEAAGKAQSIFESKGLERGERKIGRELEKSLSNLTAAMEGVHALGKDSPFGDPTVLQATHGVRHLESALSSLDAGDPSPGAFGENLKQAKIRVDLSLADALRVKDGEPPLRFGGTPSAGDGGTQGGGRAGSDGSRGNWQDQDLDPVTGAPPRSWYDSETDSHGYSGGYTDSHTGESGGGGAHYVGG